MILSVTELTRDLKGLVEDRYSRVAVQGEISNVRRQASSGHVYFRLKDARSSLDAVIFRNQARLLRFEMRDGLQVVGRGRLAIYEKDGRYQLVCDTLEPVGVGALALAFEDLKRRLAAEGLFEPERKRPIPLLPRRIGVVTSPDGAAIRDFLRVLSQRFASMPVLIAPAKVQGEGAAGEIVEAMKRLVRWSSTRPPQERVEVILLTRGGGSIEDLWAFNEERLARAIAACPIPVVSAVGHEIDFTIADFVADLRCPTPTAAAERLTPSRARELVGLSTSQGRLGRGLQLRVSRAREALARSREALGDPRGALTPRRLQLDGLAGRLEAAIRAGQKREAASLREVWERLWRSHPREQLHRHDRALRERLERLRATASAMLRRRRSELTAIQARLAAAQPRARALEEKRRLAERRDRLRALVTSRLGRERVAFHRQEATLSALSPTRVMARGYSIVFLEGRAVRHTSDLALGAEVDIRLPDQGRSRVQVKEITGPPSEVEPPHGDD